MKIHFYGYNAFLVSSKDKLIAIDPGALFFYWFRFTTLFPKSVWKDITHIFITHGDPDHYWHADRVAQASHAPVIFNKSMLQEVNGQVLALGPRAKGMAFTTKFETTYPLSINETIEVDGMTITGVKATHGELLLKLGPFKKVIKTGINQRIGWGAIGFDITLNGQRILNLGDTLLHEQEWDKFSEPDILMIPIGGKTTHNTMDENQAIQAVKRLKPKVVIPCHYNCPGLFSKSLNPANELKFKLDTESLGVRCIIMKAGDSIELTS